MLLSSIFHIENLTVLNVSIYLPQLASISSFNGLFFCYAINLNATDSAGVHALRKQRKLKQLKIVYIR